MKSLLSLLVIFHHFGLLLIHDNHMDYGLEASSSNCGWLGPNLAIPIPKFDHAILVALGITALHSIPIAPRLFVLEIWMEKMMMMHPLGVLPHQILITILMMMYPFDLPSTLIMAQGILIKRGSWMSKVSLSWVSVKGSPCPVYTLGQGMASTGTRRNFCGASLSILNGGIFNHDDIPIEFRSI